MFMLVEGHGSPDIKHRFFATAIAGWSHAFGGAIAALIGPFQLITRLRTAWPRVHVWMGRTYLLAVLAGGLDEGRYVELVAVLTMMAGVEYFCRSLGLAPFPLPEPLPGAPSHDRPASARSGTAWVPIDRAGRDALILETVQVAVELGADVNATSIDGLPGLPGLAPA